MGIVVYGLFGAQCLDGVDPGGAPCGEPRGGEGHYYDRDDRCGDGDRIERAEFIKQTLKNAGGAEGDGYPNRESAN